MASVGEAIDLAKGSGPQSAQAIDAIDAHRRGVARSLLASNEPEDILAQRLGEVAALAAAAFPWDPVAEDFELANTILEQWRVGAAPPSNVLMAAMALAPAHHFPQPSRLALIPAWLRLHYGLFLLASPPLFLLIGEADRYADHCTNVMERFKEAIFDDCLPEALNLARITAQANPTMNYFSESSMREYFRLRSMIIEWDLIQQGANLTCEFPSVVSSAKKVGILHRSFAVDTEAYFLLGRLEGRNRDDLDIILYVIDDSETSLSSRISGCFDRVVTLPTGLSSSVEKIRQDHLDLCLISNNIAGGLSPETSMAAHRLARVQVTNGSSPITPGFSNLDIFLSSETNDSSPRAPDEYEEALVRLEGSACYFSYPPLDSSDYSFSRSFLGIEEDQTAFMSASNYFKITPELLTAWAQILARAPETYLILMPFNPTWGVAYPITLFTRRLTRELARFGVAPNRVKLVTNKNRAELQAVMAVADIYLDSFPYSGSVSLIDPLLAGLPVVARDGDLYRTALAASALRLEGLESAVCADANSYIERAVKLARDLTYRAAEAARVRQAATPSLQCVRTEPLVQKFATFCKTVIAASARHTAMLRGSTPESLRAMAVEAGRFALLNARPALRRLAETGIVEQLLTPYVETLTEEGVASRRAVDAHAGRGEMSRAFLRAGLVVEMFEPDLGYAASLGEAAKEFAGFATHHPIEFFSSIARSSSGPNQGAVPAAAPIDRLTRISPVAIGADHRQPPNGVDVLNIDAGGAELSLLQTIDLSVLAPRLVMTRFGQQVGLRDSDELRQGMAVMNTAGYNAVLFVYRNQENVGAASSGVELVDIAFDETSLTGGQEPFGHAVFYRQRDTVFLACLVQLLENFGPARSRPAFASVRMESFSAIER